MSLEIRHLRAFVMLADELHFGRAAHRLHMTQPALSRLVHQLELSTGLRLFDRTTRHVSLTHTAETLLEDARAALAALDELTSRVSAIRHQESGTLRVAHQLGAALSFIPDIIRRFERDYPEVPVELREFDFGEPLAGIDTGESDIAFVRLPLDHPDLCFEPIEQEPLLAGVPAHHRLAARDSISIAEILDEPILAAPKTAGTWRDYWLATQYRGGRVPTIVEEAATFDAELQAVAVGKAVTITSLAAKLYYSRPGLAFIPIHDVPPCDVVLTWLRTSPSPLIAPFVATARAVLDERANGEAREMQDQ